MSMHELDYLPPEALQSKAVPPDKKPGGARVFDAPPPNGRGKQNKDNNFFHHLKKSHLENPRMQKEFSPKIFVDAIIRNEPGAQACLADLAAYDIENRLVNDALGVAPLAVAIGRRIGLASDELWELGYGALGHDWGKAAKRENGDYKINKNILFSTTQFTPEEIKMHFGEHTIDGYNLLKGHNRTAALLTLYSHSLQRNNYPVDLKPLIPGTIFHAQEVSLVAADVVKALMEGDGDPTRPYKTRFSDQEIVAKLQTDPHFAQPIGNIREPLGLISVAIEENRKLMGLQLTENSPLNKKNGEIYMHRVRPFR